VGIGVVAGAVFVGEALGFGHDVEGLGRLEAHAAEIEVLKDVEHLQSGEALGVGAHAADVDAAVVGDEGSIHSAWWSRRSSAESQPPMRLK